MNTASYIGTVPLNSLILPSEKKPWEIHETQSIFANFITLPPNYIATLGSAIDVSNFTKYASLATIPNYQLPTQSQYYIAGRDLLRWGGTTEPYEVDMDRYVFTPDLSRNVAIVSLAPKSEPHHLSEMPSYVDHLPQSLQELVESILKGELA